MTYKIDIPWKSVKAWEPGRWYPMPFGDMSDRVPVRFWICEGWSIYIQDPESPEDMLPIGPDEALSFSQAHDICVARNGKPFKELAE